MNRRLEIFLNYVYPEPNTGCWLFTGGYLTPAGYYQYSINNKKYLAHRVALSLYSNFDLNSDWQALHKCNFKSCVNPDHLYAGGYISNAQDKAKLITHCPKGHEYNKFNTYWRKDRPGNRECRKCARANSRRIYRKKLAVKRGERKHVRG